MVKIVVTGLKPEEHMFQESLVEAGMATAEKLEKTVRFTPEDELHILVKSHVEGVKKRFEVKTRVSVNGKVYAANEPDDDQHSPVWDLHLATKEALEDLKKVVERRARFKHLKGLSEEEVLEKRAKMNG